MKSSKTETRTHSLPKTPRRHNGPSNETYSKLAAVALTGFHSSIRVIITAILLIDTRASRPLTTPRQPASPPPRPSGRIREGWNKSWRTTGPRIPSISLSGSNRRARSWRKESMSEGVRVFGDEVGDARRGAECADSERSGVTSSGGPRGRL